MNNFKDMIHKNLKINEEIKERTTGKKKPRTILSIEARAEKNGLSKRIKSDEDIRVKREEPSFMPSGKNRLTSVEKRDYIQKVPDSVEIDAELYADIRCEMTNQDTDSDVWNTFKEEYISAWKDEVDAIKKLSKLKKLIKNHR